MKKIFGKLKNEDGQAMPLLALILVVLLGFSALVVDAGMLYSRRGQMQNAADAAALAGALKLPTNPGAAISEAISFAGKNDVPAGGTVTPTTPFDGQANKIEVVIKITEPTIFARVLGIDEADIQVRAVAQNIWMGDALPFINMDGLGQNSPPGQPLEAWNKVDPGDKERIHNDDLTSNETNIKVKYGDGEITYRKGKNLSEVQQPLLSILDVGKTVYLISIKQELMAEYTAKLKNKDPVLCQDTVLMQCIVTEDWDGTGSDKVSLKFVTYFNWDSSKMTYVTPAGDVAPGTPKLVE